MEEMIKLCEENPYYWGMIILENYECNDIKKFKFPIDKNKIRIANDKYTKHTVLYINESKIEIMALKNFTGRHHRVNYMMIENGACKTLYDKAFLDCYMKPYFYRLRNGNINDMAYSEYIIKNFNREEIMNV